MATEENDFVLSVGMIPKIDEKAYTRQLEALSKKVVPIRTQMDKVRSGTHSNLQNQVVGMAQEYRKITGATPTQAVNTILGRTPAQGTVQRDIRNSIIGRIQMADKIKKEESALVAQAERDAKATAMKTARETRLYQEGLKNIGQSGNPLGEVQEKIAARTDNAARAEAQQRQREDARQFEIDKRQASLLGIIEKNTGTLSKIAKRDQAKIIQEGRRIESITPPGESITTEREQKIVDAANLLQENNRAALTKLSSILTGVVNAVKMGYQELTREAQFINSIGSIRDYRLRDSRWMEYAGISQQTADKIQSNAGMFNDQFKFGEISESRMQGFAMFGRETFSQLRKNPNDMVSLQRAFARDIARGEAAGYSRQFMAQKMEMADLLPTLAFSPEQLAQWQEWAQSADFQQARALPAHQNKIMGQAAKDSVQDLKSSAKAGALIGGGVGAGIGIAGGAAAGAALGSVVPVIGTAIGAVVGAGAGWLLGSAVGAGIQDTFGAAETLEGLNMSNTVQVSIDAGAMAVMRDGGTYVQTFETTAALDNIT